MIKGEGKKVIYAMFLPGLELEHVLKRRAFFKTCIQRVHACVQFVGIARLL